MYESMLYLPENLHKEDPMMEHIKTLNTTPLYPSKLRRQIMNLYEGKAYKVYLGNEEIGDPEVTD